ncbi:MAG: RNA polymerase sigma factor, partial [Flavobacteriales bacterium]
EKVETIDAAKAKSYLFTAAYNAIVDWSRRQKSKQKAMMHIEGGVEIQDHSDELRVLLNRAVDTLPAAQKQLILLRDYEDYDYAQIAEITGLSDTQVRVYIFRARQTLKSFITQHWPS